MSKINTFLKGVFTLRTINVILYIALIAIVIFMFLFL